MCVRCDIDTALYDGDYDEAIRLIETLKSDEKED